MTHCGLFASSYRWRPCRHLATSRYSKCNTHARTAQVKYRGFSFHCAPPAIPPSRTRPLVTNGRDASGTLLSAKPTFVDLLLQIGHVIHRLKRVHRRWIASQGEREFVQLIEPQNCNLHHISRLVGFDYRHDVIRRHPRPSMATMMSSFSSPADSAGLSGIIFEILGRPSSVFDVSIPAHGFFSSIFFSAEIPA